MRLETSILGGMPKVTNVALAAPPEEVYEEEESLEDSEDTSRTLGEEDLDCTSGVRQDAKEEEETILSDTANSMGNRRGVVPT